MLTTAFAATAMGCQKKTDDGNIAVLQDDEEETVLTADLKYTQSLEDTIRETIAATELSAQDGEFKENLLLKRLCYYGFSSREYGILDYALPSFDPSGYIDVSINWVIAKAKQSPVMIIPMSDVDAERLTKDAVMALDLNEGSETFVIDDAFIEKITDGTFKDKAAFYQYIKDTLDYKQVLANENGFYSDVFGAAVFSEDYPQEALQKNIDYLKSCNEGLRYYTGLLQETLDKTIAEEPENYERLILNTAKKMTRDDILTQYILQSENVELTEDVLDRAFLRVSYFHSIKDLPIDDNERYDLRRRIEKFVAVSKLAEMRGK